MWYKGCFLDRGFMSFVLPRRSKDLRFTGEAKVLAVPRTKPSGRDLYRAEIAPTRQPVAAKPATIPPGKPRTMPPAAASSPIPSRPSTIPPASPSRPITLIPGPPLDDDSDENPTLAVYRDDLGMTRPAPVRARMPSAMPIPNFRASPLPAQPEIRTTRLSTSPRRGSLGLWLVGGILAGLVTFCMTYAALEPKPATVVQGEPAAAEPR